MRLKRHLFFLGLVLLGAGLVACRGQAGAPGPVGPAGPAGEDASARLQYVGTERCGQCHETEYAKFVLSGHPYKLTRVENGQPPTYPYDFVTGGVPEPPQGTTWEQISYVIGGYGWKARFIDQEGYIITGDAGATTQYNLPNRELEMPAAWVPYHAGEQVPYDCGRCHTTGYSPQGHQDDKEGIIGTWAFAGVQCEECHGPGSQHADDPYGFLMVVDHSSQLCGRCHVRGNPAQIDAGNGFEQHHEQYEDLFNSKHFALSCVTCHDPHASALYTDEQTNPNQGIVQQCESCHWDRLQQNVRKHLNVDCVDCHMPPMAKSAQASPELHRGDVRSHQFSINPDPEAPQFSEDGSLVMPYITLTFACQQCHNGQTGTPLDLETLSAAARTYHDQPTPTATPAPLPEATPTPMQP